ncbi:metal-binding protein [Leptolyngbya iicbica]|uniref:Metal-binding protein n=2 Tax=Cyanophyceae TaxID=3028117 RepID=A0A4V2E2L2_9CYAN|nr:metal-binding protein [Leptolyngbya sp. LK]RZM78946.1 metal-binding protein [Leptolyngbya sp. LK]
MPSGKTHDRVTVWLTPWVGLGAMLVTERWLYTSLVVMGFVFAGFMFGPDLDIHSVQTKRWGRMGWLWWPYRRRVRHRSWLSHGFLAGSIGRCLYLLVAILLLILFGLQITNTAGHTTVTWNDLGRMTGQILVDYWRLWVAIAIGIELGAMSHYTADEWVSSWKRARRSAVPKKRRSRKRRRR